MKTKLLTLFFVILSCVGFSQKVEMRPAFGFIWHNFDKNIPITTGYNYMAGLGLNSSGQRIYFETGGYWTSYTLNDTTINQIRFPMKAGINLICKDKKSFNMRIYTGPVAYLTIEDLVLDWSANVGIGIDIHPFFIDVGYDLGITEYKYFNVNSFYIKAGLIFRFQNKYAR